MLSPLWILPCLLHLWLPNADAARCIWQNTDLKCFGVADGMFQSELAKRRSHPIEHITCHDCHIAPLTAAMFDSSAWRASLSTINILHNGPAIAIDDGAFSGLKALTQLKFLGSSATVLRPGMFKCVPQMAFLLLDANNITSVPSQVFVHLQNLRSLSISHNQIRYLHEDSFKGLTNLEILFLDSNNISFVPNRLFRDLNNIRKITMANNPVHYINAQTIPILAKNIGQFLIEGWPCGTLVDVFSYFRGDSEIRFKMHDQFNVNTDLKLGRVSLGSTKWFKVDILLGKLVDGLVLNKRLQTVNNIPCQPPFHVEKFTVSELKDYLGDSDGLKMMIHRTLMEKSDILATAILQWQEIYTYLKLETNLTLDTILIFHELQKCTDSFFTCSELIRNFIGLRRPE